MGKKRKKGKKKAREPGGEATKKKSKPPARGRVAAGLLMYSTGSDDGPRFFLAHPGGPYFARKDEGCWSIPKGEPEPLDGDGSEDLLACARREFEEEIGLEPPGDPALFVPLGSIKQKGGKTVHAWAFEGLWEPGQKPRSNTFTLEWPPRSGQRKEFPEVDRAELFSMEEALAKIKDRQADLIHRLVEHLGGAG